MATGPRVAEIFEQAGIAFNRLAHLTLSLQQIQQSNTETGGGTGSSARWSAKEISMLKEAVVRFGTDLDQISQILDTKSMNQIKHKLRTKAFQEAGLGEPPVSKEENLPEDDSLLQEDAREAALAAQPFRRTGVGNILVRRKAPVASSSSTAPASSSHKAIVSSSNVTNSGDNNVVKTTDGFVGEHKRAATLMVGGGRRKQKLEQMSEDSIAVSMLKERRGPDPSDYEDIEGDEEEEEEEDGGRLDLYDADRRGAGEPPAKMQRLLKEHHEREDEEGGYMGEFTEGDRPYRQDSESDQVEDSRDINYEGEDTEEGAYPDDTEGDLSHPEDEDEDEDDLEGDEDLNIPDIEED